MNVATGRPQVSVIMPAYNEGKYIARSIRSILEQTLQDFELIILDDGSTDDTWDVINDFDDPRIRKERLERSGVCAAANRGLALAQGNYIARMDADDESLPQRLAQQVAFLDTHPEISILGTAYYKFDAMRGEQYIRYPPTSDLEIRRSMAFYIPICQGTVMFRRAVIDAVGGYDETLRDAEDLELWLRAAPYFRFANLEVPLYIYWFSPEHSFFEQSLGRFKRTTNKFRLCSRAIRVFGLPGYYHFFVAGTLVYNFALPNRLKRIVRRAVSRSREVSLTHREVAENAFPKPGKIP